MRIIHKYKLRFMKKFSIVIATDQENGIWKNGDLAWRIPEDMKFFKKVTSQTKKKSRQNAVIMWRKTWESIPKKFRPLPWRLNCVLSSKFWKTAEKIDENTYGFWDLHSCKVFLSKRKDIENVFIVWGSYLYNLVLDDPCLEIIYLTKVYDNFDCDVFFSPIPEEFHENEKSEIKNIDGLEYQFFVYQKKSWYIKKYLGFLFPKNKCI